MPVTLVSETPTVVFLALGLALLAAIIWWRLRSRGGSSG